MKLHLALCALAFALAACSPAPTTEEAARATGAVAKRVALPDCSTTEAKDAGADGWKHPDCRLMFSDPSGMAIEARYAPAEDDSTEVTVQVVAPGDATVQEIKERMGNTFNGPELVDFDMDGKVDIQLPLETGNVNTTWALWRQVDGPTFVRVGEPSGVSLTRTASGFIAADGRSSASEYYVSFYKLEADALVAIATVSIAGQGEPDKVTGVSCEIEDDGGLASIALTPEAAKTQFCAEPIVAGIVKDMMPTP
jgi:hypothetical protein